MFAMRGQDENQCVRLYLVHVLYSTCNRVYLRFRFREKTQRFSAARKIGYFSFTSSVKTLLIYLIIDTCAKELFKIKFVLENIRSKYSVFVSLKLSYKKYNCIGYFLVRAWCPSCMFFLQKRHNNFTRMSCIFLQQRHTLIS